MNINNFFVKIFVFDGIIKYFVIEVKYVKMFLDNLYIIIGLDKKIIYSIVSLNCVLKF